MKVVILIGAAIAALAAPALAADLPVKARPPAAPPPVYNWTGFYVGVNGGWGWNNTSGYNYCIDPGGVIGGVGCSILPQGTLKPSGGFGGGQFGYNYQSGQFVFGVEADIQAANISDSFSVSGLFPVVGLGTQNITFSQSQKLEWFGTVRGRLGWTPWDRTLLYATGGLIYGREAVSQYFQATGLYVASDSSTRTGWTVGGGLEYAFWSNYTARIEGLYYDMGNETIGSPDVTAVTAFQRNSTFNFKGGLIRGGLNYKFF